MDKKLEAAYESATETVLNFHPELKPTDVLRAWDYDGENLGLAGNVSHKISPAAFESAERAFFDTLNN